MHIKRLFYIFLLIITLATPLQALASMAPPVVTSFSPSSDINFNRQSIGVLDVLYAGGSTKKIKLIVDYGSQRYIYNLKNEDRYIGFPLQLGDGKYTASVYENTTGTKYKKLSASSGTASIANKNKVFVNSIQQVEWFNNDAAIQFANKLVNDYALDHYGTLGTNGQKTLPQGYKLKDREIIDLFYNYVVTNITYDYNKINTLNYDYVPDIDVILNDKSGICYDYSVLLAAMLRSQGIPSKLIKGYANWTTVYHAWNEVYLTDEKRWVVVDTTYDSYNYLRGNTYSFEKSRSVYTTSYYY